MKYTAEEVRAIAKRLHDDITVADGDALMASDMLTAYAERIEADEEVVPFGYLGAREMQTMQLLGHAQLLRRPLPDLHIMTPVYLRPPAQATQVEDDDDGLPIGFADWYNRTFAGQHVDCTRMDQCERAWRYALASQPSEPTAEPVAQDEVCKICGKDTPHHHLRGTAPTPASPINLAAIREVIESHINEAKKLRHDPESQDYLYEQADKLTAAIKGGA